MQELTFNLIDRPCLPVIRAGHPCQVSLAEALVAAHEIDALALADPLQSAAVLRHLLVSVYLDACGAPRTPGEWAQRWEQQQLDAQMVHEYLDQVRDRFDIFHPSVPFGQSAGLSTAKGETKPVSLLLPAVASGNNVPLFNGGTDGTPPALEPAEAALAMLGTMAFDPAGLKTGAVGDPKMAAGKTTGNPTGPLGALGLVIPLGATLAQTLLLNTPIMPQGLRPDDTPHWRRAPVTACWTKRPATGLLDLLTFLSRRIRLIPDVDEHGAVTVSRVVVCAGDRLTHHPEFEPHTMWRREKKPVAGAPPRRPVRHQPGRASWRGLTSLLAVAEPTDDGVSSSLLLGQIADLRAEDFIEPTAAIQVLSVGVAYGTQSAVVDDVMVDLIPVPLAALGDTPTRALLLSIVRQAEALREAGNTLADDIRRASGAEKLPWDKGLRLGDALVHEFTPLVRRILAGLQHQPDEFEAAETAWQDRAREIALAAGREALAAAPSSSFLGRPAQSTLTKRASLLKHASPIKRASTADRRYRDTVRNILPRPVEPQRQGATT